MAWAWYDPDLLDECFSKFDFDSEASDSDVDNFSLSSGHTDDNNNNDDDDEQNANETSSRVVVVVEHQNEENDHAPLVDLLPPVKRLSHKVSSTDSRNKHHPFHHHHHHHHHSSSTKQLKQSHDSSSSVRVHQQQHRIQAGDSLFLNPGNKSKGADANARLISVRYGPNYKRNGHKQLNTFESLYEYFALDLLRGKRKLSHLYQLVSLPPLPMNHMLPSLLIVNFQLPNKPPVLNPFRSAPSPGEDPGTSLVLYFKLREHICAPTTPLAVPGIDLATYFFKGNFDRFKILVFVDNVGDLKIPSLLARPITKFLGKPVLLVETATFVLSEGVCEVDVDVFQFPLLARQILSACRGSDLLSTAEIRMAFVLQGEKDEELPERVLATCSLSQLDLDSNVYDRVV